MQIDPHFTALNLRMEALREDASPRSRPRPPRVRRPPGFVRLAVARQLVRVARRLIGGPAPRPAHRS